MIPQAPVAPDRHYLSRMAQGDSEAAGELLRRHGMSLYALAYGLVFDSVVADEIVVDALGDAMRAAGQYDARDGTVFAWLAAITRRRGRSRLEAMTA